MSDKSQIACESMKKLTEKVIRSDLAFRKRLYISSNANTFTKLIWIPITCYVLYVFYLYNNQNLYTPNGRMYELNRQSGNSLNLLKFAYGGNITSLRELFRPGKRILILEIYYRDRAAKMKEMAKITQTEISKNEQVVFKPYIWN
jgi:hypothetical protein